MYFQTFTNMRGLFPNADQSIFVPVCADIPESAAEAAGVIGGGPDQIAVADLHSGQRGLQPGSIRCLTAGLSQILALLLQLVPGQLCHGKELGGESQLANGGDRVGNGNEGQEDSRIPTCRGH